MSEIRKNILYCIAIAFIALITNKHMSWDAGIEYLSATDTKAAYAVISEHAPDLPPVALALHHAQRFPVPYAIGSISKVLKIPYQALYYVLTYMLVTAIILLFWKTLRTLGVPPSQNWLYISLLFFNAYAIRYYLIVPGMVTDLGFVFFGLLAIYALLQNNFAWLCIALWLGLICRQTILLQLPIFTFLLLAGTSPSSKTKRISQSAFLLASTLALFVLIKKLAFAFGEKDQSLEAVTPFFFQLFSPEGAGLKGLGELFVRTFLPIIFVSTFISISLCQKRVFPKNSNFYGVLLLGAVVIAQPILGGLGITGANAGRLGALGLLPLILALAILLKNSVFSISYPLLGILFFGSLHHLYTWISLPGPGYFLAAQIIAAVFVGAIFFRLIRGKS